MLRKLLTSKKRLLLAACVHRTGSRRSGRVQRRMDSRISRYLRVIPDPSSFSARSRIGPTNYELRFRSASWMRIGKEKAPGMTATLPWTDLTKQVAEKGCEKRASKSSGRVSLTGLALRARPKARTPPTRSACEARSLIGEQTSTAGPASSSVVHAFSFAPWQIAGCRVRGLTKGALRARVTQPSRAHLSERVSRPEPLKECVRSAGHVVGKCVFAGISTSDG